LKGTSYFRFLGLRLRGYFNSNLAGTLPRRSRKEVWGLPTAGGMAISVNLWDARSKRLSLLSVSANRMAPSGPTVMLEAVSLLNTGPLYSVSWWVAASIRPNLSPYLYLSVNQRAPSGLGGAAGLGRNVWDAGRLDGSSGLRKLRPSRPRGFREKT